uniref:Headcase N-terminal domain-containing protein n=1 Tax=Panagrolaimus superbus TaxID=310955 RepID=A0A914YJC7_9BILA
MKVVDKSKNKNLKKEAASKNGKKDDGNNQDGCCIPMIECIKREDPLPQSPADGIKFDCSNSDCQFSKQYAHPECFEKLEEDLLILLRSHGMLFYLY